MAVDEKVIASGTEKIDKAPEHVEKSWRDTPDDKKSMVVRKPKVCRNKARGNTFPRVLALQQQPRQDGAVAV